VVGDSSYSFSIVDESGKININSLTDANSTILNNLIVNLGLPGETANTIVDSILDWKDADDLHRLHGAEDAYYQTLPVPYKAKNDKFDTLEELLLVRGVTQEILFGSGERPGLIKFLTVYSKGSTINLNAASREVIMALPNITSTMAERIVEFRETSELRGQQDVIAHVGDLYRTISTYVGFTESGVYSVEGRGLKNDEKRGYAIHAIVSIEGGNQHRYLYYKSPSEAKN
jgi:general secretion pathway protein K